MFKKRNAKIVRKQKLTKLFAGPCLPCRDLDEAIDFYKALGFTRTYRQLRPNPYAVVVRDELQIHLFGMPEFNPEESYGSVIVVVTDPDALYHSFAEGIRKVYGKLPIAGIPRILRPRKKFGTVYGFSVVDVGGNWLRISKAGDQSSAEVADGAGTKASGWQRFSKPPRVSETLTVTTRRPQDPGERIVALSRRSNR